MKQPSTSRISHHRRAAPPRATAPTPCTSATRPLVRARERQDLREGGRADDDEQDHRPRSPRCRSSASQQACPGQRAVGHAHQHRGQRAQRRRLGGRGPARRHGDDHHARRSAPAASRRPAAGASAPSRATGSCSKAGASDGFEPRSARRCSRRTAADSSMPGTTPATSSPEIEMPARLPSSTVMRRRRDQHVDAADGHDRAHRHASGGSRARSISRQQQAAEQRGGGDGGARDRREHRAGHDGDHRQPPGHARRSALSNASIAFIATPVWNSTSPISTKNGIGVSEKLVIEATPLRTTCIRPGLAAQEEQRADEVDAEEGEGRRQARPAAAPSARRTAAASVTHQVMHAPGLVGRPLAVACMPAPHSIASRRSDRHRHEQPPLGEDKALITSAPDWRGVERSPRTEYQANTSADGQAQQRGERGRARAQARAATGSSAAGPAAHAACATAARARRAAWRAAARTR